MTKPQRFQDLFYSLLAEKWFERMLVNPNGNWVHDLALDSARESYEQLEKEGALEIFGEEGIKKRDQLIKDFEKAKKEQQRIKDELCDGCELDEWHTCGLANHQPKEEKKCPHGKPYSDHICPEIILMKEEEKQEWVCSCHPDVHVCGKVTAINSPPKQEPKKRWRAEKWDKYFYIDTGVWDIDWSWEESDQFDDLRWENGCYFPTRESAEEALKKIKQLLLQ